MTLWKLKTLLASVIMMIALSVVAVAMDPNGPVEVKHTNFSADLAPHIVYLVDEDRTMTLDQALVKLESGAFSKVDTPIIDFGFSDAQFWLKTTIANNTDRGGTWKLSPEIALLESIKIYTLPAGSRSAQEAREVFEITNKDPFSARQFPQRYLKTELDISAGETIDLIIQYTSDRATQLPLFLENTDQYYERIHRNDVFKSATFGILIGIAAISTIYMAALGVSSAIYYAAYLFCVGMYLFSNDGFGLQLLWPNNPGWNQVASAPFGIMGISFLTMFVRSYVTAFDRKPVLKNGFLIYACLGVVLAIASQIYIESAIYKSVALIYTGVGGFIPLFGAGFALSDKQSGALPFSIGALLVGISFSLVSFGYFNPGLINHHVFGRFTVYAMVIEGFTFASAIFARTQTVRRDRAIALKRQVELTEEKLALSESLRAAEVGHRAAVQLANSQREMLASTAHDIRQPLTSLRLALMRLNGRDAERASQISDSFDYLDTIVNQSLESIGPSNLKQTRFATEDGEHKVSENASAKAEAFPISIVLSNIRTMFSEEAASRGIEFSVADNETEIVAKPVDLMRIVSNLVSNALKNTESGFVHVDVESNGRVLRVKISDSGVGIAPEIQERLMRSYERNGNYNGHGLGLAVVDRLARENDIGFKLLSDAGKGTTIILTIPLATKNPPAL